MNKLISFAAVLFFLISCDFLSDASGKRSKVIARVHDAKLYQETVNQVLPEGISPEDSLVFTRNYINAWAKKQLLFRKSKLNMSDENPRLEKLVSKYRQDLFVNAFKEALIEQKIDTLVGREELIECYEENKMSFRLNEVLLQFRYLNVPQNHKSKSRLKKWIRSNKQADLMRLSENGDQLKASFLNDSLWVSLNGLVKTFPFLGTFQNTRWLRPNVFLEKTDSLGLHYFWVRSVRFKNEIAPWQYLEQTLKEMILHRRKRALIQNMEAVLIEDALQKKEFEMY